MKRKFSYGIYLSTNNWLSINHFASILSQFYSSFETSFFLTRRAKECLEMFRLIIDESHDTRATKFVCESRTPSIPIHTSGEIQDWMEPPQVYTLPGIRFYFIRVGTFPDLYGGGLESRARSCRSLASRERSSRVWRTLKNGGSLCISDGVNPLSHRFHGVLCSLSSLFKLSGKLLVTKWKRGRKKRTASATFGRPFRSFFH